MPRIAELLSINQQHSEKMPFQLAMSRENKTILLIDFDHGEPGVDLHHTKWPSNSISRVLFRIDWTSGTT
jgi:hypothetical protein